MRAKVTFEIIGPISERNLLEWARNAASDLTEETDGHVEVDDIEIEVVAK